MGHTFLLGDRYTKPLSATYLSSNGKPAVLQMGSYGLGLSRILAAAIEVLSKEQEIRWPPILAPYSVIILPPKGGSKEESHLGDSGLVESLYAKIEALPNLANNVIIDDRTNFTIGRRFLEARKTGYPIIVAIGKKIMQEPPLIEVINVNSDQQMFLNESDLLSYVKTNVTC